MEAIEGIYIYTGGASLAVPSTRFRINDFRYRFPSAEPLFREMLRVDPWRRPSLLASLLFSLSRVSPPLVARSDIGNSFATWST